MYCIYYENEWLSVQAQKDVGTIALLVTYDVNFITAVRKADIRLLHDNWKTQVRFPCEWLLKTMYVKQRLTRQTSVSLTLHSQ